MLMLYIYIYIYVYVIYTFIFLPMTSELWLQDPLSRAWMSCSCNMDLI